MPDYPLQKMLRRIEKAIKPFPKAAMFELEERGYTTLFQQLVSCIISIRTRDEVSLPLAINLLDQAPDYKTILKRGHSAIADILYGATFPGQKAAAILAVAEAAAAGQLKPDFESLTAIKGIGPKCANLALGVALGRQVISVDVHVHRVVNRWGIVQTATPEQTLTALEALVPEALRRDINRLLMPFGKHICTGQLPHCSTCPVYEWCLRVGVTKHR